LSWKNPALYNRFVQTGSKIIVINFTQKIETHKTLKKQVYRKNAKTNTISPRALPTRVGGGRLGEPSTDALHSSRQG